MAKYDVAVIGAGPAGSMAACHLAGLGVKVALIDQHSFPRDKACGDGLGPRAIEALARIGLQEWLHESQQDSQIDHIRIISPDGRCAEVPLSSSRRKDAVQGATIPRRTLDYRLVELAMQRGASLLDGAHVTSLDQSKLETKLYIRARTKMTLTARLAIVADGSTRSLSRKLGIGKPANMIAIRAYGESDEPVDRLIIHYDARVLPGYAWVFPVNAHTVNVGVGGPVGRVNRSILASVLNQWLEAPEMESIRINTRIMGGLLASDFGSVPLCDGRIMFAGDAIGLVNPFSEEGISNALVCGEIAGGHAFELLTRGKATLGGGSHYEKKLAKRFSEEMRLARILRTLFAQPSLVNAVVDSVQTNESFAEVFIDTFVGQRPVGDLLKSMHLLGRSMAAEGREWMEIINSTGRPPSEKYTVENTQS